jgi:hypothetical protein
MKWNLLVSHGAKFLSRQYDALCGLDMALLGNSLGGARMIPSQHSHRDA